MIANARARRDQNALILQTTLPPEEQGDWSDKKVRRRLTRNHVKRQEVQLKQAMSELQGVLQKTPDNQGLYGTVRLVPPAAPLSRAGLAPSLLAESSQTAARLRLPPLSHDRPLLFSACTQVIAGIEMLKRVREQSRSEESAEESKEAEGGSARRPTSYRYLSLSLVPSFYRLLPKTNWARCLLRSQAEIVLRIPTHKMAFEEKDDTETADAGATLSTYGMHSCVAGGNNVDEATIEALGLRPILDLLPEMQGAFFLHGVAQTESQRPIVLL